MKEIHQCLNKAETWEFSQTFAKQLRPGAVIGLSGELGTGKTYFAKGVIHFLSGVPPDEIPSPSFTLVEEYDPNIYHADLYRLQSKNELEEMAWDEILSPQSIVLIEWPEKFSKILSHCNIVLKFTNKGGEKREIEMEYSKS